MKTVALGEVVDFYSGGTPSKEKPEFWDGDVPWFSAKDMKRPRLTDSINHISESVFTSTPLRKIPAGTVALVVRGMILAHTVPISIIDVDAAINQDLKALRPRRELDPAFLAAMLRAQHSTILANVSTAAHGTKKLDSRVLEEIRIPFPSIAEQRRIAAILDQADALRAMRRRILTRLENLELAILNHLVADLPGRQEFGELIEDGPTNGLYLPASAYGSGTPIVRIDTFGEGRFNRGPLKRLRATDADIHRYRIREGDILINRVNSLSHLGKAVRVPVLAEPTVYESNMMRIRIDPDRANGVFLNAWLRSADARAQIRSCAKEAINQASINQKDVRSLRVPLPALKIQHEFAEQVLQADQQRTAVTKSLAIDEELFAALQHRAFRGDL